MANDPFYPSYPLNESGLADCPKRDRPGVYILWRVRQAGDPSQVKGDNNRTYLLVDRTRDEVLASAILREIRRADETGATRFFVDSAESDLVAEAIHQEWFESTQPLMGVEPSQESG